MPTTPLAIALAALERISTAGCGVGVDVRDCREMALKAIQDVRDCPKTRPDARLYEWNDAHLWASEDDEE